MGSAQTNIMTTIAVAVKDGIAAIGADTTTKHRYSKDRAEHVVNHSKLLIVGDSHLAITGPTSGKLALKRYFANLDELPALDNPDAIFSAWLDVHYSLREHYFLRPDEDEDDSFESSRMEVLIANSHGIFGVAAHRAVQQFTRFYAVGGGRDYALGAMHYAYNTPGISAQEIVEAGISAAAEFDDSTDLPMIVQTVKLE